MTYCFCLINVWNLWICFIQEPKNRKLVPLLLGVTRESILRLDYNTKEIKESFPLTQIKRWAASDRIFSVDFGSFKEKNFSVQTTEGKKITELIAGYVKMIEESKPEPKPLPKAQSTDTLSTVSTDTVFSNVVNEATPSLPLYETLEPDFSREPDFTCCQLFKMLFNLMWRRTFQCCSDSYWAQLIITH